jgi:hypothetical protein
MAYVMRLSPDERVRPPSGASPSRFTIYDLPGVIDGSQTNPPLWEPSSEFSGPDPLPGDNPTIPNVTWTYIGLTDIIGPADLGTFTVESIFGGFATSSFVGRAFLADGSVDFTVGPAVVRAPIPEPSALLLGVSGLALSVLGLRRRKRWLKQ